jgi:hypothetical protein
LRYLFSIFRPDAQCTKADGKNLKRFTRLNKKKRHFELRWKHRAGKLGKKMEGAKKRILLFL